MFLEFLIKRWDNKYSDIKNLYSMSIQELDYATKIYSMMQEYYKGLVVAFSNGLPKYIETCMAESTAFYTEKYSKIKILQELFSK